MNPIRNIPATKQCVKCNVVKESSLFYRVSRKKDGLDSWCKVCHNTRLRNKDERREMARKRRARNPDKFTNYWLVSKYRITLEDYNRMFAEQQGKCLICTKHQTEVNAKFHVDHCHTTGKVRGLLCSNCNCALGFLKDNIQSALNLIKYLELSNG